MRSRPAVLRGGGGGFHNLTEPAPRRDGAASALEGGTAAARHLCL
jgi:hypothetical protein